MWFDGTHIFYYDGTEVHQYINAEELALMQNQWFGALDAGYQTTMPKGFATNVGGGTLTDKALRLNYWTAYKSQTLTEVSTCAATAASGGTPSLCRLGLYSVDPSTGDCTLIGSTANDATLWNGTTVAAGTRSLQAATAVTAGSRYAWGLLCVTSFTGPGMAGAQAGGGSLWTWGDRINGNVASQSDLPSTISAGSIGNTQARAWVAAH